MESQIRPFARPIIRKCACLLGSATNTQGHEIQGSRPYTSHTQACSPVTIGALRLLNPKFRPSFSTFMAATFLACFRAFSYSLSSFCLASAACCSSRHSLSFYFDLLSISFCRSASIETTIISSHPSLTNGSVPGGTGTLNPVFLAPLILLCVDTPHFKFNEGGMGFCFLSSMLRLR